MFSPRILRTGRSTGPARARGIETQRNFYGALHGGAGEVAVPSQRSNSLGCAQCVYLVKHSLVFALHDQGING